MDDYISASNPEGRKIKTISHVTDLYKDWFLDYASYVILERAVPTLEDGLKPVQRRILHAMFETNDGRFHKVANIIGNTMQYHPHGDASIGDALVNLGQKELLIDTQGNWGDILTGDSAAAPRYIEARLSKFALEVCFNPDNTEWQLSYDGRKREPVILPMKFPMVLTLGVEGIAVGLSTKIMPHNFIELIKSSIQVLKGEETNLIPDFPSAGMADFTNYNQGGKGSRIRVRSRIEVSENKKNLIIRSVPFGVTTTTLIESIIKASDSGKIKIKQVIDNTARDVEIVVELAKGVSPDVTTDALYAFTNCEISVSPSACLIINEKPVFMNVNEILRLSTENTRELLRKELEIRKAHLAERLHFASLEKIFIEKKIYRNIEDCETWEAVIETIDNGLKPFTKNFIREITTDDIVRLTEIKIKRISKFDAFKADETIESLTTEISEIDLNLNNLTEYCIQYFEDLLKKYGKGKERKTEIRTFDTIEAKMVAADNKKLYVNREEGFIGFGLRKDELIGECSDLDDIIAFRKDGKFIVTRVAEKVFVGKDIIHVAVFNKENERLTYNVIYLDGKSGKSMVKRFQVNAITRDKEYDVTMNNANSKITYFSANLLGETEIVTVYLSQKCPARIKIFDFDFATIAIKGRGSMGNILTKYPVKKIEQKFVDTSNVLGVNFWFDEAVGKLNTREYGKFLGNFLPSDTVIAFYEDGNYELTPADISNHYDTDKLRIIEKFNPDKVYTAIYFHGKQKKHFVKRFKIETTKTGKAFKFISENNLSRLTTISNAAKTVVSFETVTAKKNLKKTEEIELSDFVEVMGWKATGKSLSGLKVLSVNILETFDSEPVVPAMETLQMEEVLPDRQALTEEEVEKEEEINEVKEDIEIPVASEKKVIKAKIKKEEKKGDEAKEAAPKEAASKIKEIKPITFSERIIPKKTKKNKPGKDGEQLSLF